MAANRYALIVVGGSGKRMESDIPKQFLPLQGIPILMHTIALFHRLNPSPLLYLVLPQNEISTWAKLCMEHAFIIPHKLIAGGETRFHSVKNGLEAIEGDGLVAIHDGVRPLVNPSVIGECYSTAQEKGNAIPAVKPLETIRSGGVSASKLENREHLWLVQTPQVFDLKKIKQYYQKPFKAEYTDDASVAEDSGEKIQLVLGNRENIKITTPADLVIAEALLRFNSSAR